MRIVLIALAVLPLVAGEDLAKRYAAKLDWSEQGLGTESLPEDCWRLSGFELDLDDALAIDAGPGTLVLGVHARTDPLWGVLFLDAPVEIESELAGGGESTDVLFLRFNGKDVGELFPRKTVEGPGGAWRRAEAFRIFRHKLGWKWFTPSGNTTVPNRGYVIVDADTDAGARRVYGAELRSKSVEVAADLAGQPLPPSPAVTEDEALAVFDAVVAAFAREYAGFALLPELDWDAEVAARRPVAAAQRSNVAVGGVVADLVAELADLHAWVRVDGTFLPGYTRERLLNGNWKADQKLLGSVRRAGPNLWVARTEDGLGYLNVHGLSDPQLPELFDAALDELGDTWGLVLDLRYNGGGDETLAQRIAARFLDAEVVYAKHRFRGGEGLRELGPVQSRTLAPRGPWRYAAPVVVLQGATTMSSAEAFALMLAAAPEATTMGANTAGSSGNPRLVQPGHGVEVNVPRWIALTPEEQPFERVGVAPDVRVELGARSFTDDVDPLLAKAFDALRDQPKGDREPGKR